MDQVSRTQKRIAIVGYGRHGKDETGTIVSKITPLRYGGSTSWAALPFVAKELGVHPQVAWETRHQCRMFWKEYCDWLRRDDPAFLIKLVLSNADMAVGIRDKVELLSLREQKLVDHIIWVDAAERKGPQKDATVTFGPEDCDLILDNNGSLEGLYLKVYALCVSFGIPTYGDFVDCLKLIEKPIAPDHYEPSH